MSPPSACTRSRWPLAAPLPVPRSYPGKAACHADWTETAQAGVCTYLARTNRRGHQQGVSGTARRRFVADQVPASPEEKDSR